MLKFVESQIQSKRKSLMNFNFVKFLAVVGCIMFVTTLAPLASPSYVDEQTGVAQTPNPTKHTVAKGETIYSIARSYNIAVNDIRAANPSLKDAIKVGDVLTIPTNTASSTYMGSATKIYTVKAKETLYSIARNNGVKLEDIIEANPDLKNKPLTEGQNLRIPVNSNVVSTFTNAPTLPSSDNQFLTHKVEPQETIYGISRQYNVTTEALIDFNPDLKNGLKTGMILIIPVLQSSLGQTPPLQDVNKISIGLVLPFANKSDAQSARFVEYYEGFLVALQEMKAKGFSANVYVFDMGSEEGTTKLKSLLDTYEMKYLDLIVGGVSPQQILAISDFAKKQNIKYVIPFPTKTNDVLYNPLVFQVNAPHTVLYANVAKTFTSLFPNTNVIYITESNDNIGDRMELITALNGQLPRAGMIAKRVVADQNLKTNLASSLDSSRKNIIVPGSASTKMLQTILPVLKAVSTEKAGVNMTLFGHADWQTYGSLTKEYGKYDTYIYTPFYLNESGSDARVQKFMTDYKKWFNNKSLISTYPKYGVLGYDTGISFMTALWRNGKDFASNTNTLAISSLQTPFLFKKENQNSGYMNNGFYIVHYKADGTVDKTEYGR